jgi:DNA-directed RNA polymerase specialized sigma24 family protein
MPDDAEQTVMQPDASQMRDVYQQARTIARAVLRSRGRETWNTGTLVNEAFTRLLGSACAEQMRDDPTSIVPLLRTVMHNALTDHGRRKRSAKRPGGQARARVFYEDGMIAFDDDPTSLLDILDALAELRSGDGTEVKVSEPAQLARVLELGFVLGCSTREISAEVDLPQTTVSRWLRYGRVHLNARLQRKGTGG